MQLLNRFRRGTYFPGRNGGGGGKGFMWTFSDLGGGRKENEEEGTDWEEIS